MGPANNMHGALRSNTPMPTQASAQALFNDIRKTILSTYDSVDLEFPDIPPDYGLLLTQSFAEDAEIERAHPRISFNSQTRTLMARIMPTDVHDCPQEWLEKEFREMIQAGFITSAERDEVNLRVGTRFHAFGPPYSTASKEPDVCIRPDTLPLPTVAVDSRWSESWPRLLADKDLWLLGGAAVEAVILFQWTKLAGGQVRGTLQLHGRDAARNVVLIQEEPIFPAPATGQNQTLPITRGQIYGPLLQQGRNPLDIYPLSIANLRAKADGPIRAMGFTPAA